MNDYLGRDGAPFSAPLWQQIDSAVATTLKETQVARKFLPIHGPLGPGATIAAIDSLGREEIDEGGISIMGNRTLAQIPQLYEDFWLYWRDLEASDSADIPANVSATRFAAQALAMKEDRMVFYGVKALGIEGLLTAKGVNTQKRGDWSTGETAYADVAAAMATLMEKSRFGNHVLLTSPDLMVQLNRLQPGTGVMESERIATLVNRNIVMTPVLQPKTALLLSAQPQFVDMVIGQDAYTAYTEAVDLNHHLRVLETALVRIKAPDAIVVFK